MGVPAFYRWLSEKYPLIIKDVVEDEPWDHNGNVIPVDCTGPNPNGTEFDNLYLDMNGIIHPCFHPEDRPAPTTEEEVFECIFDYIDRLFAMIRPRKLLYMAIDGVAPRAKMNQQRSRRFRAAQEAKEKEEEDEKLRAKLRREGVNVPPRQKSNVVDSNVITPGTPFMGRLSAALQYYVHQRMNTDPAWRGVKVIMSDASVPGEGEHKAMHYIRQQRGLKGFDPNTKHVVYGLDADLIMLALATHEPNFWILREVVFQKNAPEPDLPSDRDRLLGQVPKAKPSIARKPYQLLSVAVLREYLAMDLHPTSAGGHRADLPFTYDEERVFDDFVFMCFFVGNDFLPHSPTLEIREGAIDLIMTVYRQQLPALGGYLCCDGKPDLRRVEQFVQIVGTHEEAIFQKRARTEQRMRQRQKQQKERKARGQNEVCRQFLRGQCTRGDSCMYKHEDQAGKRFAGSINASDRHIQAGAMAGQTFTAVGRGAPPPPAPPPAPPKPAVPATGAANKSAAELLRAKLLGKNAPSQKRPAPDSEAKTQDGDGAKRAKDAGAKDVADGAKKEDEAEYWKKLAETPAPEKKDDVELKDIDADSFNKQLEAVMKEKGDKLDEMENDAVRLGEAGWKGRYYQTKMSADDETADGIIRGMVTEYVRGLYWVCRYYYEGCCSWNWYYPYHYAPFATDLVNLHEISVDFEEGEPFRPFEQLMGVLPAASSHALPPAFHPLMKDPDSPIIDFYPEKFDLDMNGKRFTWQAVALLPWIDEKRLLAETRSLDCTLTNEEKRRNTINLETLLCHASHPLARDIYELEDENPGRDVKKTKHMNPAASGNMNGEMILVNGDTCPTSMPSPMKSRDDITNNQVLAVCLKLPGPTERFVPPVLMPGVRLPDPIVNPQDMPPAPKLWHVDQPRGPYGAQEFNHPSRRGPGPMGLGYQNGGGGRGGGGHSGHSGPGLSAGAHRLLQASVHAGTGGNVMQYGHGPPNHGPPQGNYYQQQQNYGNYPPAPPAGMPRGYPGPPMGGYPQPPGGHNGGRGYPGPPHGGRGGRGGGRGPPPPQGNSFAALANPPRRPPDEDPRYRR